jgi:catechol 2,3-dioxygenase-like lactoylglutathione lyase family enzyme
MEAPDCVVQNASIVAEVDAHVSAGQFYASSQGHYSELFMEHAIAAVALLVRDYDEAIAFYTECLDFELVEDTPLGKGKRWVLVSPPGAKETRLLLALASNSEQDTCVGEQAGGRVFLFLRVDDFYARYNIMRSRGVRFLEQPREESYGTVAVFEDLYGNRWDLLRPAKKRTASVVPIVK